MIIRQLVDHVVRDVRIALDQNSDSSPLVGLGDNDTLTFNELIREHFPDAVRIVERMAPVGMLDSGNNVKDDLKFELTGALHFNALRYNGWLQLPDDFFRLVCFKMSDWERPVFRAVNEESGRYDLQFSRAAGIRGTPQRPVCAITLRPTGHVLEFWSCKDSNATIDYAVYIPKPNWDNHDGILLCENCYRPAVYYAAGLVLQAIGQVEAGNLLIETGKGMLNFAG